MSSEDIIQNIENLKSMVQRNREELQEIKRLLRTLISAVSDDSLIGFRSPSSSVVHSPTYNPITSPENSADYDSLPDLLTDSSSTDNSD